jgi:hypothetical protein
MISVFCQKLFRFLAKALSFARKPFRFLAKALSFARKPFRIRKKSRILVDAALKLHNIKQSSSVLGDPSIAPHPSQENPIMSSLETTR